MTPNISRCRLCEGDMALQDLERIEGEEHGVHLCIEHMPTMTCAKGHRRFVSPFFASAMIDALVAGPLVPLDAAGRRGLLRRRYACPACGAELAEDDRGHAEARRTLEFDGLPPFDVRVDLSTFRCGACQHESIESRERLLDDLMRASARAFRSAEVVAT